MKTANVVCTLCFCVAPWLAAQQPATPTLDDQPAATAQLTGQVTEPESPTSAAQTPTPAQATPGQSAPDQSTILLKGDTEVKLWLEQELSSTTSKKGDEVRLTVVDDVVADGRVVVPRGTVLKSKVTHASPAHESDDCTTKSSGVIEFNTPKLLLANGTQVALDYETASDRKSDDSRVTPGEVATVVIASPILVPLAVFEGLVFGGYVLTHPQILFNHASTPPPAGGCHDKLEDQTLERGRLYTYYVRRNVSLPAAEFAVAPARE